MEKILIVSDTHGDIETLDKVIQKEKEGLTYLLHLGDHHFDLEDIESSLDNVNVLKVKGNCDFVRETEEIEFTINGKKIFMAHGHFYGVKDSYSSIFYRGYELGADIVLFGHTHIKYNQNMNGVHLFNPGTLCFRRFGKRTYGLLTIDDNGEYSLIHKTI